MKELQSCCKLVEDEMMEMFTWNIMQTWVVTIRMDCCGHVLERDSHKLGSSSHILGCGSHILGYFELVATCWGMEATCGKVVAARWNIKTMLACGSHILESHVM